MKIFKYELAITDRQIVKMPLPDELLDIQIQDGQPVLWAMVNPDEEEVELPILCYGTGLDIKNMGMLGDYIATIQKDGFVWHFFSEHVDWELEY